MRIHAVIFFFLVAFGKPVFAATSVNADSAEARKIAMPFEEPEKILVFNSTRVLGSHSVDMLSGGQLDLRMSLRFGEMATQGAFHSGFGFDQLADIRFGAEYGLTSRINLGIGRSKGIGPQTELWDGYAKIAILKQNADNSIPFSITVLGTTTVSSMEAVADSSSPASFHKFAHRLSYVSQILIAKKFADRFSLQLMPTYIHRNYVAYDDKNGILAFGAAMRFKLTQSFSVLSEYYYVLPADRTVRGISYYHPLAIGMEYKKGKSQLAIQFTNGAGINETQFIAANSSRFFKGEFRAGFTISRILKL